MEPVLSGPKDSDRAPPDLTDHLLEEIFVRIDAPADLARATAACKAFRRLITDSSFLRRYRSLHPPPLLGFLSYRPSVTFFPADAPHPNAPPARSVADAADFSFDYIPMRERSLWHICDGRDGRVLLISWERERGRVSLGLAVCDPLTRGYTPLPPIPDGLLASVLMSEYNINHVDAFFDPSVGYEEEQFRVMCWTRCPTMGAVLVYCSVSGSWTHGTSIGWDALGLDLYLLKLPDDIPIRVIFQKHSYAYGSLYWRVLLSKTLIKLSISINSIEFSTVSLPSDFEERDVMVVEAGEGRIGMFTLLPDPGIAQLLRYCIIQNEGENANMHPVETTIPLPSEYDYYRFDGAAKGYVFLTGQRRDLPLRAAFFSLEVKTMKVERICLPNRVPNHIIPYFEFPPFMSLTRT